LPKVGPVINIQASTSPVTISLIEQLGYMPSEIVIVSSADVYLSAEPLPAMVPSYSSSPRRAAFRIPANAPVRIQAQADMLSFVTSTGTANVDILCLKD